MNKPYEADTEICPMCGNEQPAGELDACADCGEPELLLESRGQWWYEQADETFGPFESKEDATEDMEYTS